MILKKTGPEIPYCVDSGMKGGNLMTEMEIGTRS